jgi:hypothetical protein
MTLTDPDPPPVEARRYSFLVEAEAGPDALVRVLTLFAVQSAALASVTASASEDGFSHIRIDADWLDECRAETLLRRLCGVPIVRNVALGWRS